MKLYNILLLCIIVILFVVLIISLKINNKEKFDNSKKYYFIDFKQKTSGWGIGYFKMSRVLYFFKNDDTFIYKPVEDYNDLFNFLDSLINTKTKTVIVLFYKNDYPYPRLMNLLNYSDKISSNITIIPVQSRDWWYNSSYIKNKKKYQSNIYNQIVFKNNKFKHVIDIDYKTLGNFLNQNLEKYKHNIISWAMHSCYDSCFIKFNKNPINKVLVSGSVTMDAYPERYKMKQFNNIEIKNNRDGLNNEGHYARFLNNYLCCFASSVHPESLSLYNNKTKKYSRTNCHIPLLKNYEILGAGSLLLNPLTEKPYLQKIGLIEDKNCMFIDMSNNNKIQDKIDFILDPKNRKFIDKVRKAGQDHGKKNLNSKKKFEQLKNIILNL
jgi:hypothetical protein